MLKKIIMLLLCVTPRVQADVPPAQAGEVEHLINFVQNSPCLMIRNGTGHPAEKAVEHIRKKYDYFRDDINSTEDFIEYAASKSTMTGRDYTVACPGAEVLTTRQWLMQELVKFRSADKLKR